MSTESFSTVGIVKRHPDGFGFLIPDDSSIADVYIPKHSMIGIMTNDKVIARVSVNPKDGRLYGEIARVEQRASDKIFGVFHLQANKGKILDKENLWGEDLNVPATLYAGAKSGDLVQAKIIAYPGDPRGFTGEITQVIGHSSDPLTDTKRAILMHSIPEGFSKKTLAEVKVFSESINPEDTKGRKDLRDLDLITIDGVTAKDFDDAIYVKTSQSGFKLWVAIADVSHYVKPNTSLDKDAYDKGNSSYFPHYVEPMLPEVLSNGLCSLKPKVDRLCMVCEMDLDYQGNLNSYKFYEAVMNSKARLTYGEAQEIVDGESPKGTEHIQDMVLCAADLAKILMAKRYKEGSLNLEIPETQVIIDEAGHPVDIIRSERVFAHQIIEELMLITNIAVAKFFEQHEVPALYRTHERPEQDKIDLLKTFLMAYGSDIKIGEKSLQKKLSRVLQNYQGKIEGDILSRLILRSLKQASYTVENIGHFGLNFNFYAHFTSPIRRYPDLIVHRIVKSIIDSQHNYPAIKEEDLLDAATHLSATEQRSVKAERYLTGIKRARFIYSHIGEEFDGVITSVTKFGVFVSLKLYDLEGLIRLDDLGDDYFEFIEERLELVGKRSQHTYHLGMPLRVTVSSVNIEQGQIDFVLSKKIKLKPNKDGNKYDSTKKRTNRKYSEKRKTSKKNSKRAGKSRFSKSSRKNKSK